MHIMKILVILFLFQTAVHGADIPTNTPPAIATNLLRLLPLLTSTNFPDRTKAHLELMRLGPPVLPALVSEMNKTNYISDRVAQNKLTDERWGMRMSVAMAIEDISGQDFKCKTSVHGWTPDYSFNAINDWWTNKVLRR
jgi:hypothetical protein